MVAAASAFWPLTAYGETLTAQYSGCDVSGVV